MKILLLTLGAMFVGGCTIPAYVVPTDGPVAKLLVPAPKSSYRLLGGVSSQRVRFGVMQDDGCAFLNGTVQPKENGSFEGIIPAGENIFVNALYGSGNSSCSVTGYFLAEKNTVYSVSSKTVYGSCTLLLAANKSKSSIEMIELKHAYVDSWAGKQACTNKNNLKSIY